MELKPPDLLVLDVMFPEDACGGFELARALRSRDDLLAEMPILMLTAINTAFPLGFGRPRFSAPATLGYTGR